MHFSELLAQDDGFPIQGIIFLIVAIFSFVKWLYENISNKGKKDSGTDDDLESIYEQYRDEIRQRQTEVTPPTPVAHFSPPPLPVERTPERQDIALEHEEPAHPTPTPQAPKFTQEDIERLRLKNARSAYSIDSSAESAQASSAIHSFRAELKKKNSLRKAILLREIIGPPKALQQQD